MVVSIFCDKFAVGMPCSTLQEWRVMWIQRAITVLKSKERKADFEKMLQDQGLLDEDREAQVDYFIQEALKELQAWLTNMPVSERKMESDAIDYKRVSNANTDALKPLGLLGLYTFVSYSDMDGYFTVGEAMDVLITYTTIQPADIREQAYGKELVQVLEHAIKVKKVVQFA